MKKTNRTNFIIALGLLTAFALWTVAVCRVDVQPIGPHGSSVGFATLNRFVWTLTGFSAPLYIATDWLGLIPILFTLAFSLLGFVQWIKRKHIRCVDWSILSLGIFYLAVIAAYALFEVFTINYRPILIDGFLESSYPSSTTVLVMCVMPTAIAQLRVRIRNAVLNHCATHTLSVYTVFMVICRLISGVHWLTDIIGGALLSAGLVMLYHAVNDLS